MPNMGELNLNIADVEVKDFGLIPNGTYHCRVERMEEGETGPNSKAPGTPKFNVGVSVVGGEKYLNRWVWDTLTMSQKSLWKFKSLMEAIGIDESEYGADDFWPDEEWIEGNVIGAELDVSVGRQPASGDYEERNKVNSYKPHKFTDEDALNA